MLIQLSFNNSVVPNSFIEELNSIDEVVKVEEAKSGGELVRQF